MAVLVVVGRLGFDDLGNPSVIEADGDTYPISDGDVLKVFEPWSKEMEVLIDWVELVAEGDRQLPLMTIMDWFDDGWLSELTKKFPL